MGIIPNNNKKQKNMCKVTVLGRLGGNCTMRQIENEKFIINFSVVENIKKINKETGELIDFPQWFNCSYFTKKSKVNNYLLKGNRILIHGNLEFDEFVSTKTNRVQTSNNITVNDIQLIDFETKESDNNI